MSNVLHVGYIGLGNIGKPSARHLVRDGIQAHVYDVVPAAVEELVGLGATGHDDVASLAGACSHIGICVRDDAQVEAVLYGDQGIFANAGNGTLVAIHSTVTREAVLRWSQDAAAHGMALIDAAISAGAQGA